MDFEVDGTLDDVEDLEERLGKARLNARRLTDIGVVLRGFAWFSTIRWNHKLAGSNEVGVSKDLIE